MKYDFLILSSLPLNSGCYLRCKYLAEGLKRCGARVKLISPCLSKPLMLDFLFNFIKYFFIVIKYEYKVGIAVKPYPNTVIPLLLMRIFKSNKIVVDIDDIDFGYREGIISFISRIIQKPFPRYFNAVTYHNALLKKFIQKEYHVSLKKLYVLKQGVDFTVFNYNRIREITSFKKSIIKKYKLNTKVKILIYTAHLNIAADLDILLKNMHDVFKENCFLIIAGGGPMLSYYQELVSRLEIKNVCFTGYLTPKEIVKYVLCSDFSLVFYKDKKVNYYRSSMKLREQLALKRRIICNNVGELKLFKQYTYQSKTDIASYIKLVKRLIKTCPKDNRHITGYQYVKKNYDWDKIASQFLTFIKI